MTVTLPLPLMARARRTLPQLAAGRELFDLELDVEYETWSRVKAFTVDTNGLVANAQQCRPRRDDRTIIVPKQWHNVVSVKLGGDFELVPERWTLRAGVYYETAVASPAYANVDFPGGAQLVGARSALASSSTAGRWR